jgi:Flp pilus assembly protein TadD
MGTSPTTQREASSGASDARLLAVLLLLAVVPYANTLTNSFVYDDSEQILANPYIRNWKYLPEIFGSNVWSFLGAAGVTNHYRPLMTLSYLVCYQVFGLLPFGFHLVNIALHAGVVWLVFGVSIRLFGNRTLAFVSAALFALHPIHTESVAWVAAVTDLQLTFFYLLTFWLFLRLSDPGGSAKRMLAMAASFLLTLFAKEQAATLPVVAMVYEHFYRADRGSTTLKQKLARYGPLWLLAFAYIAFRVQLLGSVAPVLRRVLVSWPEAILSGFALTGQYVWKLLWPVELCAFYVFRRSESLFEPAVLTGIGVMALLGFLFYSLWRTDRNASLALLWFALTLGPVLNARWMSANVFAERYLYLPSVGFCWLVGWLWTRAWAAAEPRPLAKRALVALLCVVGLLYGARVVTRNRDWRNDEVLFTETLRLSPDAYLIRMNLGVVYWNRGEHAAAVREWQTALPYNPDDPILLNNLGLARAHEGKLSEAEALFRQAMQVRPNYAQPYFNLGRAYEKAGRPDDVEREYRAALERAPLHTAARNHLARLFLKQGRLPEAEREFKLSLEAAFTPAASAGLGTVLVKQQKLAAAEEAFRRALDEDPYEHEAYVGLGDVLAATNRPQEAIRAYEEALRLNPASSEILRKLEALKKP